MVDVPDVPTPTPDPRTPDVVFKAMQDHEQEVGKPMEKWSGKDFSKFQKKFGATAGKGGSDTDSRGWYGDK